MDPRRRCAQRRAGPPLVAHVSSCSVAAARNVSAAARRTFAPRAAKRWPSLATVVVLPVPLTPMTSTTAGTPGAGMRGHGVGSRGVKSASSSAVTAASASATSFRSRARSTTCIASVAPTSAAISASSTSSHAASSSGPLRMRAQPADDAGPCPGDPLVERQLRSVACRSARSARRVDIGHLVERNV